MSGIPGVAAGRAATTGLNVEGIAMRLRHRGPDASGSRSFGECVLGHTRLRIIDLSPMADQPMANEDETVWAVFNGEIYNFRELRSELEAAGHRFRSTIDTEVLVHLFEERGEDMATRLRGMFSFAVWDGVRRRRLLCRDRLGIKPLCYRIDGERLSFASEVQALVGSDDAVDPDALACFLRLGWVSGPRTITSGISELLPGGVLVSEDGRALIEPYWSLPNAPGGTEPLEDGELADALRDAMRRHLVADAPVGLFLSAGVDSAAVARLAADVATALHTYTVAFDTANDESREAASMARRLGLQHTVMRISPREAMESLDAFTASMDQQRVTASTRGSSRRLCARQGQWWRFRASGAMSCSPATRRSGMSPA